VFGCLKRRKAFTVFDDVFFNPLSMETLSNILLKCVENPRHGVFNVGSKQGASKAEFAFLIAEKLNFRNHLMRRGKIANAQNLIADRPKNMMMNVSRFEKTFEVALPNLEAEIDLAIKDYKNGL
jgi:dTDP-4-dehydrorhamnose reductase